MGARVKVFVIVEDSDPVLEASELRELMVCHSCCCRKGGVRSPACSSGESDEL